MRFLFTKSDHRTWFLKVALRFSKQIMDHNFTTKIPHNTEQEWITSVDPAPRSHNRMTVPADLCRRLHTSIMLSADKRAQDPGRPPSKSRRELLDLASKRPYEKYSDSRDTKKLKYQSIDSLYSRFWQSRDLHSGVVR